MIKTPRPKLSDLQPVRESETLIRVPTILQRTLAEAVMPLYEEARQGNDAFRFYKIDDGNPIGSRVFNLGLLNKVLAENKNPQVRTMEVGTISKILQMLESATINDYCRKDLADKRKINPSIPKTPNTPIYLA